MRYYFNCKILTGEGWLYKVAAVVFICMLIMM